MLLHLRLSYVRGAAAITIKQLFKKKTEIEEPNASVVAIERKGEVSEVQFESDNVLRNAKVFPVVEYQIKIPSREDRLKVKPTKFRYLRRNLIEWNF